MGLPVTDQLTPEFIRLMQLVENNIHYLVKQPMSLTEARDLQQRIARPLGVLNARFGFQSASRAKQIIRHNQGQTSVDKD